MILAITKVVESINQIVIGNIVFFFEQQLIDCSQQNNGCEGRNVQNRLSFIVSNGGINSSSDYPYQGEDGYIKMDNSPDDGVGLCAIYTDMVYPTKNGNKCFYS